MSMIDSTLGSLAASLMSPQVGARQGGIANPYMNAIRRQQGQLQSAQPRGRGQGTPMAQHVAGQMPGRDWFGNSLGVYNGNVARTEAGQAPGANAVTLGFGGGPGGQGVSVGENEPEMTHPSGRGGGQQAPAAGPKTLSWEGGAAPQPLPADAKGAPTWRDQMKLDEGRLSSTNNQYNHLDSQMQREFDPSKKAALQAQLDALHGQRTSLEGRIYSPTALEDYQAAGREERSQQDVDRSSATIHQPVQLQPGDVSQSGHVYQPLEQAANQAASRVRQPTQVKPGEMSQSGHPYQPADPMAQHISDTHQRVASLGIPQSPEPGGLLDANQAAAIKHAAGGNSNVAARVAHELGYDITKLKPAQQQAPAYQTDFSGFAGG